MQWTNTLNFIAATPTIIGISVLGVAVPKALADIVCRGTIFRTDADNLSFSVPWSPNTGFEQEVEFRNARTGAGIAQSSRLKFDRTNDQGQRLYRGNVSGMASVTLIDLAEFQPRPGTKVSVSYDGQWGRGTCSGL
ncbi:MULTISPECIES: hypothetical protein [Arthrospira]|jgi:hypothetical protein|uniref:Uncharacterized protein n=1 Tax=Limnospira platensis NIES-46 TaxID=1236695 RepID=A0A5M3T949_LIMPL|nr:hypothetical protein [Arthrospira platensis]AMW27653.1 hypothetical protein AP285_06410 [Arthrospira platensis YZ]KDR58114.1 hypothetical protein APPUASWS_006905 [Arthrospira platensis str. Paraca]MBD2669872.1 hypothetical protein [Arthrospira platensis FACHB-439]MBD2711895.1 hypothetical protein [Arthrospira platensis FACHB-835]MDF2209888.1 hypothetical protein [Arthrospira platensis NCB002]MDT9183080.1 hypothetical protein [Limnospira sp. PMC 289.06]MDT9295233.1 hypothetical protein [Ar